MITDRRKHSRKEKTLSFVINLVKTFSKLTTPPQDGQGNMGHGSHGRCHVP
jgi:hypothetical protein